MLVGKQLSRAFDKVPMILGTIKEKKQFLNGKTTDVVEAVRLTALTQDMGSITIDLCPFSTEKLERCKQYFGSQFTISDLIGIENCKIYAYEKDVRVNITAADLRLVSDPMKEVVDLCED